MQERCVIYQQIREYIAEGELELALNVLNPHVYDNTALVLRGRLSNLNRKRSNGEIDHSEYTKILNNIRTSIIENIDQIFSECKESSKKEIVRGTNHNFTFFDNTDELIGEVIEDLNKRSNINANYKYEEVINKGDRSLVLKISRKNYMGTKKYYALKIIKTFNILREENRTNLHGDVLDLPEFDQEGVVRIVEPFNPKAFPWYFVMEYVPGKTIGNYLENQWRWRVDEVLKIIIRILETIRECHENDSCPAHGDLRPHEIFLDRRTNKTKISPFRVMRNSYFIKRTTERIKDNCRYMSPEELAGGSSIKTSDQFSIGLLAYEMLEGKKFFEGDTPLEIIKSRIAHEIASQHKKEENPQGVSKYLSDRLGGKYPLSLQEVLDKMLAYDYQDRYKETDLGKPIRIFRDICDAIEQKPSFNRIREVSESYRRCRKKPEFIQAFYQLFFERSIHSEEKFKKQREIALELQLEYEAKGTSKYERLKEQLNVEKQEREKLQYDKLDSAIDRIVNLMLLKGDLVEQGLQKVAQTHQEKHVNETEYTIFKEALIDKIEEYETKSGSSEWNKDLKASWDDVLSKAISFMVKSH